MEKAGTKTVARELYQRRKTAVKMEQFCLTHERERQRRQQAMLFANVAERYLAWAAEHRPRSLRFRRICIANLLPTFGQKPLAAIGRSDIERYFRQRLQGGVTPATVNRDREVLSHLFSMAQRWKLIEHNPVSGTDRYTEHNENPRPLTREEEAQLFAVLPERYHAIVTLALHTGLRLNELRTQRWEHVDLAAGTLRVTMPKSKKHEVLPLNAAAFALLAGLPQQSEVLFPDMPRNMSSNFVYHVRKAGMDDITFHCLRDTYISRLAPHVSVPTLMQLARHRSLVTTQRYLKIDDAHLRDAVEKLVPMEP
jgi:integrase